MGIYEFCHLILRMIQVDQRKDQGVSTNSKWIIMPKTMYVEFMDFWIV